MKKLLLVVMLVLGMVTIAQAVPTWDLTADATKVHVNVTSNAGQIYLALAVVDVDGQLTNFTAGAQAPASSAVVDTLANLGLSALGQGELWAMAHITTATPVYIDGEWLKADWALESGKTTALVSVYEVYGDMTYTLLDTVIVPEPATIALLGIGGLFLSRRRK